MLEDPAVALWDSANSSIPALRTTQLIVDPNHNATSTSVYCNTTALGAYRSFQFTGDNAPAYTIDSECNLVAMFSGYRVNGIFSDVTV